MWQNLPRIVTVRSRSPIGRTIAALSFHWSPAHMRHDVVE